MDTTKLTSEEALRRWNASKENKRKMVEKLENLVRKSCLERTINSQNIPCAPQLREACVSHTAFIFSWILVYFNFRGSPLRSHRWLIIS